MFTTHVSVFIVVNTVELFHSVEDYNNGKFSSEIISLYDCNPFLGIADEEDWRSPLFIVFSKFS